MKERIRTEKSLRLAACILSALLIAGCGGRDAGQTAVITSSSDADAGASSGHVQELTDKPAAGETPGSTPGASAESHQYLWPIFEGAGIRAEYISCLAFDTGRRMDAFRVSNSADESLIFEVDDVVINDTILTNAYSFSNPAAGSTDLTNNNELTGSLLLAERDGVVPEKISGTARVLSWEEDENGDNILLAEEAFSITFPDGWSPELVCEPAYDMLAEEQVLSEENGIRISLLGCGQYLGAYEGRLYGILQIENNSGGAIPYVISGAELDGITQGISVTGSGNGTLDAGATRFFKFSLQMEDSGIASVSDMRLQVLTDEEQNTGTFRTDGGVWYPVTLARHGDPAEAFVPGEAVYEDDLVRIGYLGGLVDWHPADDSVNAEAHGSCFWNLSVINKSEENIEIELKDVSVNSISAEGLEHRPVIGYDNTVGMNAKRNIAIQMLLDEELPLPELSFRIQIRKQGGGALLSYPDEVITLQ